ncbi:MAG: hypothetical protein F4117_00500 [Acidimicrobiales bacterium]|nr:hypothetical protein [Acidimicrobiales bacterium]MXX43367.1 hypothetical protein [Acidimicrobiales bacterium]MXZ14464.1 hypothetical protein [Acidimicrobiales bacterium]MYA83943.1 hypothetical protein [Acidimicrobiales bacterium]MYB82293.1 hypothetical protein [Acidimicrobiales bacterium]
MKKKLAAVFALAFLLLALVDPAGAQSEAEPSSSTDSEQPSEQPSASDSKQAKKEFKKYLRVLNKDAASLASQSADGEQDEIEFYCCHLEPRHYDNATDCTTKADNPHISTSRRRSGRGNYIKGNGTVECGRQVPYIRIAVKLQTQRWWGTWQGATGWAIKGKANKSQWYHSAELKFTNHQGRFRTLVASEVQLGNGDSHYAKALSRHVKITNSD